jgi:hypothetical protein
LVRAQEGELIKKRLHRDVMSFLFYWVELGSKINYYYFYQDDQLATFSKVESVGLTFSASNLNIFLFSKLHFTAKSC